MFSFSMRIAIFDRAYAILMWVAHSALIGVPAYLFSRDLPGSILIGGLLGLLLTRTIWKSEQIRTKGRRTRR